MTAYSDEMYYWKSDKSWYGITEDGEYYMKDDAPVKAKESFEKFKKEMSKR